MHLRRLWLTDFRCYEAAELELPTGVSVIAGANAQGKTSLLEAVGWISSGRSFRGVVDAALVRTGCERAVVRAEVDGDGSPHLVEAEIRAQGRNRVLVDRKTVSRLGALAATVRVTVFAPDDLDLVKGGPSGRRDYLDDLLVATVPRYAVVRSDYERVLRQRNALLRGGMRGPDAYPTLDVFDAQLATAGAQLVVGRVRLLERLAPLVADAYAQLAATAVSVTSVYGADWLDHEPSDDQEALAARLAEALAERRRAEIDRGVTLVGPHRDELRIRVDGFDSRTQASQGEQRTVALSLRLAGHRLGTQVHGSPPVLLLDDVFSELDERRSAALVAHLDEGQTLITTAGILPDGVRADRLLRVVRGSIEAAA